MPQETLMVHQEAHAEPQALEQEHSESGSSIPDMSLVEEDARASESSAERSATSPAHVPYMTESQQQHDMVSSSMYAGVSHVQHGIFGASATEHTNSSDCAHQPKSVQRDTQQLQAAVDHDESLELKPHGDKALGTTLDTMHGHQAHAAVLEQQRCSQLNEEVETLKEQLKKKDEQLDIALGQLWGALDEIETLRQATGGSQDPSLEHTDEPYTPTLPTHPILHRVHQRLQRAMHGISQQITVDTQPVDPPNLIAWEQHTPTRLPIGDPAAGDDIPKALPASIPAMAQNTACRTPGVTQAVDSNAQRRVQSSPQALAWKFDDKSGHACMRNQGNTGTGVAQHNTDAAACADTTSYAASTSTQEGDAPPPQWAAQAASACSSSENQGAAPQRPIPTTAEDTPMGQEPYAASVASCSQSFTSPADHDSRVVSPLPFCSPLVASPTDLDRAYHSSKEQQATHTGGKGISQGRGGQDHSSSPVLDQHDANHAQAGSTNCAEVQTESLTTEAVPAHRGPSYEVVATAIGDCKSRRDQQHHPGPQLQHWTTIATQTSTDSEGAVSSNPCSAHCRSCAMHGPPMQAVGAVRLAQYPRMQTPLAAQTMQESNLDVMNQGGQLLHHGCCTNCLLPAEAMLHTQHEDQLSAVRRAQTETQYTRHFHDIPCMQTLCASDGSLRSVQIGNAYMSPAMAQLLDPLPSCSQLGPSPTLSPLQNEGVPRTPGTHAPSLGAFMHSPIAYAGTLGVPGNPLYGYGPSPGVNGGTLNTRRDAYSSSVVVMQMPPHLHRWAPPSFQSSISTPDASPNNDVTGKSQLGFPVSTSPKGSASVKSDGSPGSRANLNTYSVVGYNKFLAQNRANISPEFTSIRHRPNVAFGSFLGP